MATVTLTNGLVSVEMSNQEVAKVRQVLLSAKNSSHQDFKNWLTSLETDWDQIIVKQGNTNTFTVSEDDAKQFQDLTGEMRESNDLDWDSDLNELDSKIHNLWLQPADQFSW